MKAKKKASPARDGDALDAARPCRVERILRARTGHRSQAPNTFGTELSTGPLTGPFLCPRDGHFRTQGHGAADQRQDVGAAEEKGLSREALTGDPSYIVHRVPLHHAPRRTASRQGLTVPELRRMTGGTRFLFDRKWKLFLVTVAGDGAVLRRFKSRLADAQRRGKMRTGMYVEVREGKHSMHSHFIVAGTPAAIRAIRRLVEEFGVDLTGNVIVDVRPVYELDGLLSYLSKEATAWACQVTGRDYRRHKSAAIGDRVKLGKGLESAMLAAGQLEPYRKTYATPTAAKVARPKRRPAPATEPVELDPHHLAPSQENTVSKPGSPDPTAAERQRRRRAKLRAERDAATVTHDATVTPCDVTPIDDSDDYPTQGTRWATVEEMFDDSDEVAVEYEAAHNQREAQLSTGTVTEATVIRFEEARNRLFAGRWPRGQRSPTKPTYYDVVTGKLVA